MAAFTSKATGNWSASGQTTWNEVGTPGSGDTVTIAAHTITVDVNTTIGTSPNDITTKVIDRSSASSILKVAAGVILIVKGNIGGANGSTTQIEAGGVIEFDPTASGGTPAYRFINVGFEKFTLNGTFGNLAAIRAVVGSSWVFNVALGVCTISYGHFLRASSMSVGSMSGGVSFSDSLFDGNASLTMTTTATSANWIFDRNTFQNGTGATDAVFTWSGVAASGTRRISQNIFTKPVTYNAKSFLITKNYFGGGITCVAASTYTDFRLNFSKQDGALNDGNGAIFTGSMERNYFAVDNLTGNPHFISATALLSLDNVIAQNVFESHTPDIVDLGDCVLVIGAATSGGFKVIARNNIVLPSGYSGAVVASGTLLTLYSSTTALFEGYRNTANANTSSAGGVGKRGMFAFAEAGNGAANTVTALKSNVGWGSSSDQGYLGERVQGDVKDIVTAANADKNWTYNLSAGDNQRSYNDKVAANTLWTAGDAVAAGVDVNQGTGDPQFYDSARNIGKWCLDRGYGANDYATGLVALQADPATRIPDLIDYVFEGFRVQNSSCRNAAHDGGCVGAANFHKSTRSLAKLTSLRNSINTQYGISI